MKKKNKEGMKSALKALSEFMGREMGEDNKESLKKPKAVGVKIMSDSPEGAIKGMTVAKKIMEAKANKLEDGGMTEDLKGKKKK